MMALPFEVPDVVRELVSAFPEQLIFATISGAHLYGFPSPDSDFDVRGCHVLPPAALLQLRDPEETHEIHGERGGVELDVVSHDVRKFGRMLLKRNGYVLEQLLSPLVLRSSAAHTELAALAPKLVTRHHAHHYLGFARNQWTMFEKEPRTKTLLYVYRVLLTGIHLMRSARIEASLPRLLEEYPLDGVEELVQAKREGAEKQQLPDCDRDLHAAAYAELVARLEAERDRSQLPGESMAFDELNDFVLRVRERGVS